MKETSRSYNTRENKAEITLSGTTDELKALSAALFSESSWVRILNGNLVSTPAYKEPDKEKAKGRSEEYWEMLAREQWEEDKKLGILDWDGK